MKTLKVIAALLDYPDAEIQAHADELVAVIQSDTRLPEDQRREIADFALRLARTDLMEAQADYIETFDRGRSLSLSLFEHVHGESRDRGQAMVDLLRVYEEAGFSISVRELPDYLPLFLEFLSTRTQEDAVHWLAEVAHILQLLYTRLEAREKPFARLFRPLLYLAGEEASTAALEEQIGAQEGAAFGDVHGVEEDLAAHRIVGVAHAKLDVQGLAQVAPVSAVVAHALSIRSPGRGGRQSRWYFSPRRMVWAR